MIALLFPGQGAQEVGMGQELAASFPVAAQTFAEADETLGYALSEICFNGPAERLTQTDICQPALVTVSVAAWRVAAEHGLQGDLVMGHSLGEYSALVVAGAMSFDEALRIVAERGAAMQDAAEANPGTMAALLGMADDEVQALCDEAGDCWPANYNCPGQVVVSGTLDGIERLTGIVGARGGKITRLAVGGAFHSPLMESAAARLSPALDGWTPAEPTVPFLSTTSVRVESAPALRDNLNAQLTAPVRFGEAGKLAVEMGMTAAVELGTGRVLSGLMKRINRRSTLTQVAAPADLVELEVVSCR